MAIWTWPDGAVVGVASLISQSKRWWVWLLLWIFVFTFAIFVINMDIVYIPNFISDFLDIGTSFLDRLPFGQPWIWPCMRLGVFLHSNQGNKCLVFGGFNWIIFVSYTYISQTSCHPAWSGLQNFPPDGPHSIQPDHFAFAVIIHLFPWAMQYS